MLTDDFGEDIHVEPMDIDPPAVEKAEIQKSISMEGMDSSLTAAVVEQPMEDKRGGWNLDGQQMDFSNIHPSTTFNTMETSPPVTSSKRTGRSLCQSFTYTL